MGLTKPFRRNYRAIKRGPNSGYSDWAYIRDKEYAKNPEHYVRALILIQHDLQSLFEYVEPSDECRATYSYRIHSLFMRTCIEIEENFKAIFDDNIFSLPKNQSLTMNHYRRIDVTHHLSSYEVLLPIWNGNPPVWRPFEAWKATRGERGPSNSKIEWYQAYNSSKHNRHDEFKRANLENLIMAITGLLVVISSQFRSEDFSAGPDVLSSEGNYHPMEASIGSLFRIKFPDDWDDDEVYDFDWSVLKTKDNRFSKINYDKII